MAIAKYRYIMDFIADKELYKAVMFACKLRKGGMSPAQAVRISSNYYGKDMDDIWHYMSQRGGRRSHEEG